MQCLGSMIHLQNEQIAMEGQTSEAKPTNEKRRTRLQDGEWRVGRHDDEASGSRELIHYGYLRYLSRRTKSTYEGFT
jgi:hypothetical protein